MARRLLLAALLVPLTVLTAACAAPAPSQPGQSWRLWTERGPTTEVAVDGEFAVLRFAAPVAGDAAIGADFQAALAAALRDRGRTTLSGTWVAQNLPEGADSPVAGVLAVEGAVLRWEDHAADRWLRAEVGFRLCVGGQEQLSGNLHYTALLTDAEAANLDVEGCRKALIAGLAGRLADELLEQPE